MEAKNRFGGYLHKTTIDEFLGVDRYHREALAKNEGQERATKFYADVDKRRAKVREAFPFTQVVKCSYPENDVAIRWCWERFGPPQTDQCHEHHSEYPGCPLVQATMTLSTGCDRDGTKWSEPEYKDPGTHGHEGVWTTLWLGKTGYDFGYSEYCFQTEFDRDVFAAVCESLGIGERYYDAGKSLPPAAP